MAKKGAKAKTKGNRQTISKFNVTLTKQAATLLNKALRHKVFRAKQKLGSFRGDGQQHDDTGEPAPGAGAPGTVATSGVGVSVREGAQKRARPVGDSAWVDIGRAAGTARTTRSRSLDGSSVTLPLPSGDAGLSFANGTVTGTIPLSGGIQLDNGQVSATITIRC